MKKENRTKKTSGHGICLKYSLLPLFFLYIACTGGRKEETVGKTTLPVTYARGFTVSSLDTHTEIEVRDPWDSTRILQRYLLVDKTAGIPRNLPKGTLVRTPVERLACYSSVICGILDELGALDEVVGVCESQYVDISFIRDGITSGRIADLGNSAAPNVEKMIEKDTRAIMASPFENSNYGAVEKTGIPIIECADYMEATPLGRAEWIRFYGLFCGKGEMADSIFRLTEERYLALKNLVSTVQDRPTLLAEKKYGSVWYVPGGNSYMANLYKDAGASYLFAAEPQNGSIPFAFEAVFDRAVHADFWLIKYNNEYELSYSDLKQEYAPYANFDAFGKRNIYGCNTAHVRYYEELPMHPDYLLAELVHIFHPHLLPGYTPRYFRKLKE